MFSSEVPINNGWLSTTVKSVTDSDKQRMPLDSAFAEVAGISDDHLFQVSISGTFVVVCSTSYLNGT